MSSELSLVCMPEFATTGCGKVGVTVNLRLCAPRLDEAEDDDSKRSVVSLSAVLDKSGSMAGKKMALVKRTVKFMLAQLGCSDKLGVVEYDSEVNELIPLSKTSSSFKREAGEVIAGMREGSCTNLSGGLFQGISQQLSNNFIDWEDRVVADAAFDWVMVDEAASVSSTSSVSSLVGRMEQQAVLQSLPRASTSKRARHTDQDQLKKATQQIFGGATPPPTKPVEADALRSVFLFTDGIANVGLQDQALVEATQKLLDASPNVRVFTFGFGSDHSERLLSELATAGSGAYYYVENEDQIAPAFADALGGLLSVAAQNVTLRFEPSDGVVIDQLHTHFKVTDTADAKQIHCGDLLSEEIKDILVAVHLPSIPASSCSPFKFGTLHASYFDVKSRCMLTRHVDLTIQRSDTYAQGDEEPNLEVALQRARIDTVAALAEGLRLADAGDCAGACARLEVSLHRVASLKSMAESKGDGIIAALARILVADLEEAMVDSRDPEEYQSRGSKSMRMKGACRSAQRCTFMSPQDEEAPSKSMSGWTASPALRQRNVMSSALNI